jgi:hypothetical protein
VIVDLDATIERLLRTGLPGDLLDQVGITFETPDDQFPPASVTLPAIDLFLYDVRENTDLRSAQPIVERTQNGTRRRRPPVRVDCSYLITAWATDSSTNRAQDEHRILGSVIQVLLRHQTLPAAVLQGGLKEQEPPLPVAMLQPGRLQSVAEFWQALGGKPKAAVNYTVTVAFESLEAMETGLPVLDRQVGIVDRSQP